MPNKSISTLEIVSLINASRKETADQAESVRRESSKQADDIRKELGTKLDGVVTSVEKIDSRVSNIEGRLLVYAAGLSIAFSAFFAVISKLLIQ